MTRSVLQPGDQLHKRLLSAGLVGPADQVARSLYNIEIARSDRTVIYETPEGYGLRRGGNPMEMLSNFVVRILGNVAFGDGSALHHSAAVLVGGGQHETVLPTRLLDQPRELVEHIHQLLTLKRNTTVPMLRDPGAFRSVVFYLRGLLPRLPSRPGIPFLGWNHKRDVFYMPGCILSMDAPNHGAFVFHPDVCALDAFDSGATGEGVTDLDLGEELLAFVLMTLGMLIKGYRRERQQIIQVRHDGPAASLLAGLFRGLGQVRSLNKVDRDIEGLQGYPAWAAAARMSGRISAPYFVLAPAGRHVTGVYGEAVLARAAGTLRALTRRVW
jgi:hypothetical protein